MSKNNNGNFGGNNNNNNQNNQYTIPNVVFNTMGLEPTACEFTISLPDLSKKILDDAKIMLKDASDAQVTFYPTDVKSFENDKEGRRSKPYDAYLWIKSTSEDVCDSTLVSTKESAIHVNTVRYSDELRKYMDTFAVNLKNNGKDIGPRLISEDRGANYKGIQISLKKLFSYIFDINGETYAGKFGVMQKYTDIEISTVLDKKGELVAFRVVKKIPNRHSKRGLMPQKIKRI